TRFSRDWSSDVCSSDLHRGRRFGIAPKVEGERGAQRLAPVGKAPPLLQLDDGEQVVARARERLAGGCTAVDLGVDVGAGEGGARSEERRVGREVDASGA